MTVKEWLSKGITINEELEQLQDLKTQAYNMACGASCGSDGERVQTSKGNSAENKMIAYADYSRQVDDKIAELILYRGNLLKIINRLDNPTHRLILIARYVKGDTWVNIADNLNYSIRAVYKIHNQALKALEMTGDEKGCVFQK